MRKNKWIALFLIILGQVSGNVFAEQVTVGEISGIVMLNKDGVFVKVGTGMELEVGDQVYVLENSSALLLQGNDCAARLNSNELFKLDKSDLCAQNSNTINSQGPKLVAAIGLDEPTSDSGDAGSNTELPEDQQSGTEGGRVFSGLAAKLAVPATLTGAVLFSTIAGGGGVGAISPE